MSRIPSTPDELRQLITDTEERPADPAVFRTWALIADHCNRYPHQRVWIEEVLRQRFLAHAEAGTTGHAAVCNIARQCQCRGLASLFAAKLEEPLHELPDADIRGLMGAVLELGPEQIVTEPILRHGRRPDVFAVAVHLVAACDAMEAATFIRAEIARVLAGAEHPGRVFESLAKLCVRMAAHRVPFIQALAILGNEHRQRFLDAVHGLTALAYEPDIITGLVSDIEAHWPKEETRVSQTPHPQSIELVRSFIEAAQQGDDEAARASLIHPDDVRELGPSAVAYARTVQDGAGDFLAGMVKWPEIENIDEPLAPLGPGLGGAVMFKFDVTLANGEEETTVPIVVLEHGNKRKIALPVRGM